MTEKEHEDSLEFALEWLKHEAKFEIVNPNIPQCARAILAHIANLSAWVPVSERQPGNEDFPAIGYDSFYGRVGEIDINGYTGTGRLGFIDDEDCNIEYWQSMPLPPRDDDD